MGKQGEIYLEFIAHGDTVKVTAIDAVTGIEVATIAPKTATREQMTRVAVAKLKHVMNKQDTPAPPPSEPRGRFV